MMFTLRARILCLSLVALALLLVAPIVAPPQCLGCGTAIAAEATPAAPAPAAAVNWYQALIPLLVPILIAGLKMGVAWIPGTLLPIIAPLLGGLADAGIAYATGAAANPMLGAMLGSAGVGVREIVDQLTPK
jgi:hypothetical protein